MAPSLAQQELDELRIQSSGCAKCSLAETRTQVVFGSGTVAAELMFIGEGPGKDEDISGQPFVGRSGKLLIKLLEEEVGLGRDDIFIANVVKCRPPGNRDPKPDEISSCNPWLEGQIRIVQPKVIVTLGNFSSKLLLKTTEGITKIRGRSYEYELSDGFKVTLVPTFHPSAALQGGGADVISKIRADLVRAKTYLTTVGV